MTQSDSAVLEFGERAVIGARREAIGAIGQAWFSREHFEHLVGVLLPVGGAVEITTRLETRGEQRNERRLDQPALVVARLVPWIREKDMNAIE